MIELLGCESVLAKPGQPSFEISWDDVRAARSDIVIAACCGFGEARASRDRIPEDLDVRILNGYEHFSRPGPGLMQSAELLARILEKMAAPESKTPT
jgi:hypothetical protein